MSTVMFCKKFNLDDETRIEVEFEHGEHIMLSIAGTSFCTVLQIPTIAAAEHFAELLQGAAQAKRRSKS